MLAAAKMAEAASDLVTFDIFDGIVLDPDDTMLESLTDEEHLEVTNIVTFLESAQEDSLQHFEIDQNTTSATRHENVCNEELDRLASKNSALATTYQTKWAVAVIKAKYYCLVSSIFHET